MSTTDKKPVFISGRDNAQVAAKSEAEKRIGVLDYTPEGKTPIFKDMNNGVLNEAETAYKSAHKNVLSSEKALVEAAAKVKGDLGKAAKEYSDVIHLGKLTKDSPLEAKKVADRDTKKAAFEKELKKDSSKVSEEAKAFNEAKSAKATARGAYQKEVAAIRSARADVLGKGIPEQEAALEKSKAAAEKMSKRAESAKGIADKQSDVAKSFKEAGDKVLEGGEKRGFLTRNIFKDDVKTFGEGFSGGNPKKMWNKATTPGKLALAGGTALVAYGAGRAIGLFGRGEQANINQPPAYAQANGRA